MEREAKAQFDPGAVSADISGVLTALAGVTELGSTIDIRLESAEPLTNLVEEVMSRTKALAEDTLEKRVEAVGAEDSAIATARQPIERLPLGEADASTVVGTIRDVSSDEAIGGGRVVAKDPDGQVIGEAAVDETGNFAIELTGKPTEVRIEALDRKGKSVSVSTVELGEEEEPAAHLVELVSASKKKTPGAEHEDRLRVVRPESGPAKADRSANLTRIRKTALEPDRKGRPFIRRIEKS